MESFFFFWMNGWMDKRYQRGSSDTGNLVEVREGCSSFL